MPEPLPKVSVAARIERGYYEDRVRIIDADDHFNRLGDFVREAVFEKIDRWKKDHPLAVPPRGSEAEVNPLPCQTASLTLDVRVLAHL